MKINNTYPLKQKLLDFLEHIIIESESNPKMDFPKELELENFAVKDFHYVSFYLEISIRNKEKSYGFEGYSLFLTDKNEFKKEIYSDRSINIIKEVLAKTENFDYIFLVLAREEIFHFYKNPMIFIEFFEIFNTVKSNVDYLQILSLPKETSDYLVELFSSDKNISDSFNDKSVYDRSFKSEIIRSYNPQKSVLKDFINNFVVYAFVHYEQSSTSRRDYWSYETEFCLFYKGIRVYDEYINSLLPKTKKESFDDYNDSTPGITIKNKTTFKISYLETQMFHSKYNFDDHIVYLSPFLDSEEFPIGKMEKQTVFHEFGHIVGWELANILGFNFGNITQINLDSKKGNAYVMNDNYLFKKRNDKKSIEKYNYESNNFTTLSNIDLKEQDFQLFEIRRIKMNIESDKKRVLAYFIYLLSGSIFNLYYLFQNQSNI